MNRFSTLIAIVCIHLSGTALAVSPPAGTEVIRSSHATHIARITKDSIVLITGTTNSFTVDTPEDQGLLPTALSPAALPLELASKDGSPQQYQLMDKEGHPKPEGAIVTGDRLVVTTAGSKAFKIYQIALEHGALSGQLQIERTQATVNSRQNLVIYFTAGQRSPDASVRIFFPVGIAPTMEHTTVNVIGRGDVLLKDLATQSIGRTGTHYSYTRVGNAAITKLANGATVLTLTHLDLRPANGPDIRLVIENQSFNKTGGYLFKANYTTSAPEVLTSAGTGTETAVLTVTPAISDFERVIDRSLQYRELPDTYTKLSFRWGGNPSAVQLMQSDNDGKTWQPSTAVLNAKQSTATITGLAPNKKYTFRLSVKEGAYKGYSNLVHFYSGKMDIKDFGVSGNDNEDNTQQINDAIEYLHKTGGGTLLFSKGMYSVRTVHLQSNVYLYVEKGATIKAIKGADAPEATWFSDKKYRSGLSPTDPGPYADPENYLTKQDVGHHYFRNSMFFGERLDNVKIIGNGLITGNGNLVTGDRVMNNTPDNRGDKMFTLKLCTNLEIGGIYRPEDLWYDSTKDEPCYIDASGANLTGTDNMLHIDRAGHFALLAAGTDNINVHDTWFGQQNSGTSRDIYDFMECNNVTATNIYTRTTSDDIIKPGSDCALGFTRPAAHYKVRNVIGDTNCNLFQIGSETADDIMDLHVDNIYVLGANKAGFSISTNDGAHIKDVHLNCGHTGPLRLRSRMYRATTPFFISISNRGRVLGADVGKYAFTDNGEKHNELLVKNVNIGQVENIVLNGIDVYDVYAGSSFSGKRWKAYDGTQKRATPIIAGYSLPDSKDVEGGLDFKLPNGLHTGYIKNVVFNDVHILVKGGNPAADTLAAPPELGVGQYNVSNLKVQPSYGIWARHVADLGIKGCSFNYEQRDGRYAFFLDDVLGAQIDAVKLVRPKDSESLIKLKNASHISITNTSYYLQ